MPPSRLSAANPFGPQLLGGDRRPRSASAYGDDRAGVVDLCEPVVELVLGDVKRTRDAARLPLVGPADVDDLDVASAWA